MGFKPEDLNDKQLAMIDKRDRPKGYGLTRAEAIEKNEAQAEKEMHDQFSAWLRINEIEAAHGAFGRKTGFTPGWPDYSFAVDGKAVAVEFKTESGKLTEEQQKMFPRMESNGWKICIARSLVEAINFVKTIREWKSL